MQKINYSLLQREELEKEFDALRYEFHALFDNKIELENIIEAYKAEKHNLLAIVTQSNIVRDCQKIYFQHRTAAYLERSKIEERKLDNMIKDYLTNISKPIQTALDL